MKATIAFLLCAGVACGLICASSVLYIQGSLGGVLDAYLAEGVVVVLVRTEVYEVGGLLPITASINRNGNASAGLIWWQWEWTAYSGGVETVFPLWSVVLVCCAGAVTARRRWARRLTSEAPSCAVCGYSLRGNVSGRCPECGARRRAGSGGGPEC